MSTKIKLFFTSTLSVIFFSAFSIVNAAIVPNCEGNTCKFTQLMELVENVMNFIIVIAVVLAGIIIGYAGFLFIVSGVNVSQRQKAISNIKKAITGLVFVLIAWLLVELVIRVLVNPGTFGKLSDIFSR